MQVYSKKIIRFIEEIKKTVKEILKEDVCLKVFGNRFYDRQEKASYPILVVVYNNKSMLGYFDPYFYEMGFNELLMHTSKDKLKDIIRHEIAHYMTYIMHGHNVQTHGAEFKAYCQKLGWGSDVYLATTCLDNGANVKFEEENSILRKVQKLMALSASQNQHESEQAMIKSQQLLLKHHLDAKFIDSKDDEKIFLKRILQQKKEDSKMRSIAIILQTFFVTTVFSRNQDSIYLEIVGDAVNVDIAEYVAGFLNFELDGLWNHAKKEHAFKGLVAKNSFFLGLAKGYCDKIQLLKKEYNKDFCNALMIIEKKLDEAKEMVYPHLRKTKRSHGYCPDAASIGQQVGNALSIHCGITGAAKSAGKFLGFTF